MPDSNQIHTCPNCGSNPGTGKFCPSCGQRNKPTKLNLRTIFGEFFAILFNLDNQFFRTLGATFIPGKLATEFAKGKRKMYLHPLRFFFYSWVLLALVMNWNIESSSNPKSNKETIMESIFKLKLDDTTSLGLTQHLLDSLKNEIKDKDMIIGSVFGSKIHLVSDTAKLIPPSDTLKTILFSDLNDLSKDSLFQKYEITSWADKFKIQRAKRFDDGFMDIFQYMMDHFIWLFFAVIPFSALWLWALYGRSKKYYAEHILYLLYLFSVLFIFFTLAFLSSNLPDTLSQLSGFILWIGLVIYSFMSMKNYYGQGKSKTFFKWNAYLFINFLLFLIFSVLYSIVAAALF